jgi:hypothetical protein
MVVIVKTDYIKVKTLNETEKTFCSDCDKFQSDIEYNGNHYSFYGYQIYDKSVSEIISDLDIKIKAFYKVINKDNKQNIYNEILLSIAELMFKLRVDLGV